MNTPQKVFGVLPCALGVLLASLAAERLCSQSAGSSYYDDAGRLIRVIDSSGNELDYTYDPAGNLTGVTRKAAANPNALAIINFTPQTGGVGTIVTIQGQNFGVTPEANTVSFNGAAATVLSASSTTLTAAVPATATTGPISVTVNGQTATTAPNNFTFAAGPTVVSVSPRSAVSGASGTTVSSFTVTGAGLTGATFAFLPVFTPPAVTVTSAAISPDGTTATLALSIAANTAGAFTLQATTAGGSSSNIATTAGGSSSNIATTANTLNVLSPDGDADGDGLTNAVEVAIGTDPLNPDASGDGLPDGWQVFYGLNPLDPSVAGEDIDNSGLTVLQDFQMGLSPVNPNRVPPAVSQITPANGANPVNINGVVVVRFAEPLLTGTSVTAAQAALTTALGANTTVSASSQQIAAQTLANSMNRTCCGNSVLPGTVTLTGPYGPVQGTVTASNDSLSVTFASSQPLAANTAFTVAVSGVRDAAGNLMTTPFTSTFTTGTAAEFTPPAVSTVSPQNDASGVPVNAHYTVVFSKTMDPSTLMPANFFITLSGTNTPIAGMVQVDADGVTASFVPAAPLEIEADYVVKLSTSIKDIYGNSLPTASYSFSTGDSAESAPHLTAFSPGNNATYVGTNALMNVLFSEPVSVPSVNANTVTVTSSGQPVAVMMALSSGNQRLTITPMAALNANATYTVTLSAGILDLAGLALDSPQSYSFQTGPGPDTELPSIITTDPPNGSTGVPTNTLVQATFDKPFDPTTVTAANVLVYPYQSGGGFPLAGTIATQLGGGVITFAPSVPLDPETDYCISIARVLDYEGNGVPYVNPCFTTGTGSVTTPPTVIAMSPQNGSTGVPLNAQVELQMSEPIAFASALGGLTELTAGGSAVSSNFSINNSAGTITLLPTHNLAASTLYTVNASGFTDYAGNAVTPFTGTFTTGTTTISSGQLQTTTITPANGSTNVSVATPIVVTFNEPVNPSSVNDKSVEVQASVNGGASEIIAGSYSVNGAVATFTPLTPLPGSATVTVTVDYYGSVDDLAGNPGAYNQAKFTTAATADTTAPAVVSVTPANGATGMGLTGQVTVKFSKSMNSGSFGGVVLLAGGQQLPYYFSISSDNTTIVLGSLALPASTTITIAIPNTVTDLSGNALAPFTSTFTTGTAFNTTQAAVSNQRPANGATNVSVTASPLVLFVSKPMNASTVTGALHVAQNGELIDGTVSLAGGGQSIIFTPSSAWQFAALVTVLLDSTALDTDGVAVAAYQGQFTVASDPAAAVPVVVNYSPGSNFQNVPLNAIVDVGYSQPLDSASLTASNIVLSGPSGNVAGAASLDTTGMRVLFKPSANLAANSQYCFSASRLQGANGQTAQNLNYCFNTGTAAQTQAPTITAVSPPANLSNAPVNSNIGVAFSGPIDPLSVNAATVQITGGGQTAIPASIRFSNGNQTATVTPEAPLPASTAITVTIAGVTDMAGNTVSQQVTQFTTGTESETARPTVLVLNPPKNAANVPQNSVVSLTASAVLDPTSVNTATISLYDETDGTAPATTPSLSADGATIFLAPVSLLPAARNFQALVNSPSCCITDLAGNALLAPSTGFTTGFGSNSAAPAVLGVSPPNNASAVPINAQIMIRFNEPVDLASLTGIILSAEGTPTPLNVAPSSGNQTLVLVPAAGLEANATYTLTIAGVTDLNGDAMTAPVTSTFTTGSEADLTTPSIVFTDPENNSSGAPTNTEIHVEFSKPMNLLTLGEGSVLLYSDQNGNVLPGTNSTSAGGAVAVFTPAAALEDDTVYCAEVTGVEDLEGNSLTKVSSCFTTGESTDTVAPSVLAISPSNGATGVPLNPVIEADLSETISAATLLNSAITVSAGATPVPGVLEVNLGTSVVLKFTPNSPLAPGTTYSVSVGGFTDLAGNAATAFTSTFTTGATTTPGPLSVSTISPANNTSNVSVTSPVTVTFNEPVNALTVNDQSVNVQVNNVVVAGYYAVNGAAVTFTPQNPYPADATVAVAVDVYKQVQDLAGNAGGRASATFTTASTADTSAPTVLSVTPASGAVGIGPNGQVVVTFSKSMNPSSLTACCSVAGLDNVFLLAGESALSFQTSMSADNRMLTLSSLNLPANSTITLVVTHGATDLSGNSLADFTSQFATGPGLESANGSVVNQRPANGASAVSPAASPVVLFLNVALDPATVQNALHVLENGQVVAGTTALEGNGQTIEFTPSASWAYSALVEVYLDQTAVDVTGLPVNAYQSSFTVAADPAATTPEVVSLSIPAGWIGAPLNSTQGALYNVPLNPSTVNTTNVTFAGPSGQLAAAVSLDHTGTIVRLTPSAMLAANSEYCINLFNLVGANGLKAPNRTYCFTTGTAAVTTAPAVQALSPANQLTAVPVNARIGVLFTGTIDPLTANASTITLSGGQNAMPASIAFSNNDDTVEIVPEAPLPASTALSLTVSGVRDVAGNTVATQTTSFTTSAAADILTPGMAAVNPPVNQTGVPLNAAISLTAAVPLDATLINASSFAVYNDTLNQQIAGAYSLSADAQTAFFVPSAPLAASTQYTVYFAGDGMTDLVGKGISSCCRYIGNYSFTTGTLPSSTLPAVTGVNPPNGQTQTPTNVQVVVTFNEPVSSTSLGGVTLNGGGSSVPFTATLSNGNQVLMLAPTVELAPNTVFTLTVGGITDSTGNAMNSQFTSSFTTGPDPDFTELSVAAFDPGNGLTGVPLNANIDLRFTKPIDVAAVNGGSVTLYLYNSGTPVNGTLAIAPDAMSLTLTPAAQLAASTTYCFSTSSLMDEEGQLLHQNNQTLSCFTTGTTAATASPTVTLVSPANGATGVAVNARVQVTIGSPISSVSVQPTAVQVSAAGVPVTGTLSVTSSTLLTFTPASSLASGTVYTVSVSEFTDLAGNLVTPFTSTFTTTGTAGQIFRPEASSNSAMVAESAAGSPAALPSPDLPPDDAVANLAPGWPGQPAEPARREKADPPAAAALPAERHWDNAPQLR